MWPALTLAPVPQALPPSGIHIFASQLHTHLTGRKVVTVLARDGREREVVNRDDHYSPHFQVGTRPALRLGLVDLLSPDDHRNTPFRASFFRARPQRVMSAPQPACSLLGIRSKGGALGMDSGVWPIRGFGAQSARW